MSHHDEVCPVGCRCNACKADEIQRVAYESEAVVLAKALKLIEAMAEPCSIKSKSGNHAWRICRRCLACQEAETEHGRLLMVAVARRLRKSQR